MKLYGSYTSPYVRHCRIVLLETGLVCEFVESNAATSATHSPTQKLPFLEDGRVRLTDSCAIIQYLREKSGEAFLPDVEDYDRFCLINTALDAAANVFMLEKDGITPTQSPYLQRQQARIQTCLQTLEDLELAEPWTDVTLRLACFLDWTQFRQRLDLTPYPLLGILLDKARAYPPFAATTPQG